MKIGIKIWTPDEIYKLPKETSNKGWFFGIVRYNDGKLWIKKIYPSIGAYGPLGDIWKWRSLWWIFRDIVTGYDPRITK